MYLFINPNLKRLETKIRKIAILVLVEKVK